MMELETVKYMNVDGKEVAFYPTDTYLTALRRAGFDIPTLCYDPELTPSGNCRLCSIEVEGARNLVSSCSMKPRENDVVHTDSQKVRESIEVLLELIIASHPLKCIVCDKQGNCTLEKLAYKYLDAETIAKYQGAQPERPENEVNDFFMLDYSMCIRCGKCVQVVDEIQNCGVLSMAERGFETFPSAGFGQTFEEAGCVACGNCVSVCPVDALKPISAIKAGKEPDFKRVQSTCVYCGVGCQLEFVVDEKKNKIVYVDSVRSGNRDVNGLALCVKGRYGWDFIHHEDRLNYPLIREDGELRRATWDEAMDLIERRMKEILADHGPEAFAFLSSAKCTNEENYLMQKFARSAIGTNNVDHCARLCHASTVTGLVRTFGSGAMTNSIQDLTHDADVIFVIGSNTTEAHPVIGNKIKRAKLEGRTELIVADPRNIELAQIADIHMQQRPGTDIAIINAMLKVIIEEDLVALDFVRERTEGFDELVKKLEGISVEDMCKIAGVEEEDLRRATKMYATADRAAIVYSMGITQHSTGTYKVASLANLAMITGNVGKPGTGVNPLRGQNNVQGACDLGALPDVYPGYQKVADDGTIEFFKEKWDNPNLSQVPGLTVVEMMHAAHLGMIKAMYIMGENPALSDPNVNKVRDALSSLDFLVVQDLFLSETAHYADVVLPVVSFAEKDGTFTNTERRVQRVNAALRPEYERRADWKILADLLRRFGIPADYNDPSDILREINEVTPIYGGITPERLEETTLSWPCRTTDDPGTRILHEKSFTIGKGKIIPIDFQDAAELPDEEYPYILTTGRNLYHFHTGEMTHRSEGLHNRRPYELTEINPVDADKLGIKEGDMIRLTSRRGSLVTIAKITEKIKPKVIFMTFHHREAAANLLTNDVLDPYAKIPELKVAAIRIEKVDELTEERPLPIAGD